MDAQAKPVAEVAETRSREASLQIIGRVFGQMVPKDFGFVLWDGTEWGNTLGVCTIVLSHPGSLRAMFLPPSDLTIGEAFLRGDFDIEGDIERACEIGLEAAREPRSVAEYLGLAAALLRLPAASTLSADCDLPSANLEGAEHCQERDSKAIRHHYDVGNDFYSLWLDDEMAYSCAYFRDGDEDIHSAQRSKFDHICRKLHLEPGDRVLDIGCGWGGLARHAAREFDAEVVGITLSPEQASLARERTHAEGLDDRVSFRVLDYREAPSLGTFDKLVSVGMFEHVGADMLPEYFSRAMELLRPGGLFLNHGIASAEFDARFKKRSFIHRYVFPDGQLETISEVLTAAEKVGFEVRDVESLREHYAMTLRHWIERLERNGEHAVRLTNEATYRVWRLYMAGSAYNFRKGNISVFQSLLVKPTGDVCPLPLTREHLYTD